MNADKAARKHFDVLSREEIIQAIYRLANSGFSDYSIATATRLSVEMIRQVLATRIKLQKKERSAVQ